MDTAISHISFPGLGIGEFSINKVAFTLFGHDVVWYGILITLGIVLACVYASCRAKNEGLTTDDVLDYAIYAVIFGVLGARIYYVASEFSRFKAATFGQTLYNIIAIWNGGLGIYGGIIAGILAIIVVSRFKKVHPLKALDMISPGVMIGQIIGRWGNFFNAEAFGYETTLPWRMGIRNIHYPETIFVHPTFLYESLWNLIGFLIINALYKKKKYHGQIFVMYITWYGLGRMLIEGLRSDSLMVFGLFRKSQVLAGICFLAGAIILIILELQKHGQKPILEKEAADTSKNDAIKIETKDTDESDAAEEKETEPETENADTENKEKDEKNGSDN